jgi:hypothetical protein
MINPIINTMQAIKVKNILLDKNHESKTNDLVTEIERDEIERIYEMPLF